MKLGEDKNNELSIKGMKSQYLNGLPLSPLVGGRVTETHWWHTKNNNKQVWHLP